jgi:hypothetical protein
MSVRRRSPLQVRSFYFFLKTYCSTYCTLGHDFDQAGVKSRICEAFSLHLSNRHNAKQWMDGSLAFSMMMMNEAVVTLGTLSASGTARQSAGTNLEYYTLF